MSRPRDPTLDDAVLRAARDELAARGWEGFSVAAVAAAAGTTRAAVYRRHRTRAALAVAAIASIAAQAVPEPAGDPFVDLVRELEAFRRGISRPDGVSMVGTMLHRATDPELRREYRTHVVAPRRRAFRRILDAAREQGRIDADADLDLAVHLLTGSWYARALATDTVPRDWARRVATLVWRSVGGVPSDVDLGADLEHLA